MAGHSSRRGADTGHFLPAASRGSRPCRHLELRFWPRDRERRVRGHPVSSSLRTSCSCEVSRKKVPPPTAGDAGPEALGARALHQLTLCTEQMGGRLPTKLMAHILLTQEDQGEFKGRQDCLP